MFYYDPTYILLLPAIILALYAQMRVQSAYSKYKNVMNQRRLTGAEAARRILNANGLSSVLVERTRGTLSDHYDPRTNVVRLSEEVYDTPSVAAVGIAAHEVGHAIQHNFGYMPIKLRNTILPVAQFSSGLAMPLILLGILISKFSILIRVGILLYAAVVAFQLITLPVELNASRRALASIREMDYLSAEEIKGTKKVLSAAALTYIAAAATAILQLVRLIALTGNHRRRD